MSEIITWKEMQRLYDGEWLLIAPIEMDEDLQVVKGEVLAHSKKQEDIYQAIEKVGQQPLALEYVGEVPEGIAFIL